MTLDEIDLPKTFSLAEAAQLIESCAEAEGLRVGLRGTLASFPGCIHWHFKKGRENGTLEITLLNRERRIVLNIPRNRVATWTEPALERLSDTLRSRVTAEES